MVEMAQGNIPFHEKNLNEVIKRNVRSGRLVYSTDIESFFWPKTHLNTLPTWRSESRGLVRSHPSSPWPPRFQ
jgi:hypothetical protein